MYSSSTSVRYKFEWLCASNLHLQFLIPWPSLSIVESEKDVLEVTIRATALVPLLDSIADSLHATVVQIRVIRVSPEDFQSDLLRHLCLDLLPCAELRPTFFSSTWIRKPFASLLSCSWKRKATRQQPSFVGRSAERFCDFGNSHVSKVPLRWCSMSLKVGSQDFLGWAFGL